MSRCSGLPIASYNGAAVTCSRTIGRRSGIGQIFWGRSVALNYDEPGLPPNADPRTPDIIVTPNVGVTYTGSASKLMEHGGFAHDDTNVMLLLVESCIQAAHGVFRGGNAAGGADDFAGTGSGSAQPRRRADGRYGCAAGCESEPQPLDTISATHLLENAQAATNAGCLRSRF